MSPPPSQGIYSGTTADSWEKQVDGFFVARFKKIAPTPANAVQVNHGVSRAPVAKEDAETVDRTPVREEGEAEDASSTPRDAFGGFDDEEDAKFMQRAKRNAMRRRGLDPHALDRKGNGTAKAPET